MTKTQKRVYALFATPIAIAISAAGLIIFRIFNMLHVYCIFFVLLMLAVYQIAHVSIAYATITNTRVNNRASSIISTIYSMVMFVLMVYIACSKDERLVSTAAVLTLAILAVAGVSAFVTLAASHIFGKKTETKAERYTNTKGFDYIPEKERYVKDRKKRQRQHAADKVLALGAFGNETFIAIYGSLVFITLIIAVFNDLQLF